MQDRHLCWPPTFSLAPQWPPHFFHYGIATAHTNVGSAGRETTTFAKSKRARTTARAPIYRVHEKEATEA